MAAFKSSLVAFTAILILAILFGTQQTPNYSTNRNNIISRPNNIVKSISTTILNLKLWMKTNNAEENLDLAIANELKQMTRLTWDLILGLNLSFEWTRYLANLREMSISYPSNVTVNKIELPLNKVALDVLMPKFPSPQHSNTMIISLHGGGFAVGTTKADASIEVGNQLSIPVICVNYRLAPEHHVNESISDVIETIRWITSGKAEKEFGIKPDSRIIIGGTSAGGALTLLTLSRIFHDDDDLMLSSLRPSIAGAILFSPLTDFTNSLPSVAEFKDTDMLSGSTLSYFRNAILSSLGGSEESLQRHSPLNNDLSNLPMMYVSSGGEETLRDDARQLVQKLRSSNVTFVESPRMFHAFQVFSDELIEARSVVTNVTHWFDQNVASKK